jgi:hypothetical protein
VLKDGRAEVTLDKSGRVSGLDEVFSISLQEIAKALLTERVERPEVLKTLGGEESNLRGSNNTERILKLLYPTRRVIIEDRLAMASLRGLSLVLSRICGTKFRHCPRRTTFRGFFKRGRRNQNTTNQISKAMDSRRLRMLFSKMRRAMR